MPDALLTLDNVVLLPHLASGTLETRAAMEQLTLANLESYLSYRHGAHPVPEVLSMTVGIGYCGHA